MIAHGADQGAVAPVFRGPVDPGPAEGFEGEPPRAGDLVVGKQGPAFRQRIDEGPHDDGWEHRDSGGEVVERTEQGNSGEIEAHFFPRFAPSSGGQVRVAGAPAAAGKRELAGPAIAFPFGALDQEQTVGFGGEDDRDRRTGAVEPAFRGGAPTRELLSEGGKLAQRGDGAIGRSSGRCDVRPAP